MIPIPGILIAILTFPGVVVHEAAHAFFCKVFNIPILAVKYFQFKNPAGYVIHGETDDIRAQFFITMGPFIINSLLCVIFCSAAFMPVWVFKSHDPAALFFYWLGLSIGMHAFPSRQDLKGLSRNTWTKMKSLNPWAILSVPLIAVLYPLNFLRIIWADLGYGIAIGILIPLAIFEYLA